MQYQGCQCGGQLSGAAKDADRLGASDFILVNFGTHTSTGTPQQPLLKSSPISLCILCMSLASIFYLTIILLEFIAIYQLMRFSPTFHLMQASDNVHLDRGRSLALGRVGKNIVCHVVYACDVVAMVYDIAHVCVADLD